MNNLAEKVAVELLSRDGPAAIWEAHLAAARAYREGHPRAAEILLSIADAAEKALRGNHEPHPMSLRVSPGQRRSSALH